MSGSCEVGEGRVSGCPAGTLTVSMPKSDAARHDAKYRGQHGQRSGRERGGSDPAKRCGPSTRRLLAPGRSGGVAPPSLVVSLVGLGEDEVGIDARCHPWTRDVQQAIAERTHADAYLGRGSGLGRGPRPSRGRLSGRLRLRQDSSLRSDSAFAGLTVLTAPRVSPGWHLRDGPAEHSTDASTCMNDHESPSSHGNGRRGAARPVGGDAPRVASEANGTTVRPVWSRGAISRGRR